MPGHGPVPKVARRRRNKPQRGEWQPTTTTGWQHGAMPAPPDGLKKPSIIAWRTWFAAWFAAQWTPADLPGLRLVIRLYDQVERNDFTRAPELRMVMDGYGITPKGQQDRRWSPPTEEAKPSPSQPQPADELYAHLKVVDGKDGQEQ